MVHASTNAKSSPRRSAWQQVFAALGRLSRIELGRRGATTSTIRRRDLHHVVYNLATLLENGLSLPKSLITIAREPSMHRYGPVLEGLRRGVEMGESVSSAMANYPQSFNTLIVQQVKVGERSGTLASTLGRIASQLEKASNIRAMIFKKLAYPAILMVGGTLCVTFMLLYVIPVFEETYRSSGVPLPLITQFLITVAAFLGSYGWILLLIPATGIFGVKYARRNPRTACAIDRWMMRLPLVGSWFRDLAVLQFMDVLGTLLESGFTVVDALNQSAAAVGNRAVRECVHSLEAAIRRGERFSRELDRYGDLFPPVVSQLAIVGEKTGKLGKATADIRDHLRRGMERNISVAVGTIEPLLTISLAAMIGVVLLAIYLPMFDMIGAVK